MARKARDIDRFLDEIKAKSGALTDKERIEVQFPVRDQRRLIDLIASYTSRCGHLFEQNLVDDIKDGYIVLPRHLSWDFLHKHDTDQGRYYRWRTYAYTQGDSSRRWRQEPFQMVRSGSVWVPPKEVHKSRSRSRGKGRDRENDKKQAGASKLGRGERQAIITTMSSLNKSRESITEAMLWCLNHAPAAEEITALLCSRQNSGSDLIPNLYLISDILHNSCSSAPQSWSYRKCLEEHLPDFFVELKRSIEDLDIRAQDRVGDAVDRVFESWTSVSIFSNVYTKGLETSFIYGTENRAEFLSRPEIRLYLPEYEAQHFSQLEKQCKVRGLPCNSARCAERPTEEQRKRWLYFHLAAFAFHCNERPACELDGEELNDSLTDLDGECLSQSELAQDNFAVDTFPEYDVPRERDTWLAKIVVTRYV
eukprot:GEMP01021857.1.p1 GENE.GEMP01021857.1~~GEMP01021857.1.p1  ORF type:complete len:429 (+),score=66.71 GEMP01021857.1:23-1288(+)